MGSELELPPECGASILAAFWNPVQFPGLNDWTAMNKFRRNDAKKQLQRGVFLAARAAGIKQGLPPAYWTYFLCERKRNRDPSNIAAIASKVIEDAMQAGGYIANDGWDDILGIQYFWRKQLPAGICVVVSDSPLSRSEAETMVTKLSKPKR